jgi:hypothetical protein
MSTKRIKPLALTLVAVLTVGAGAAAVAHASTEGPLLIVNHELLGSGEEREVTATVKTPFAFKSKTAKVKVECKAVKLKTGATVNGSARKSGATGNETFEFSQCAGGASGESLTGCEPEGGKITSAAIVDTVGFANSSRTGPVLVLLAPETGTTLATVKFVGEKCTVTSTTIEGRWIGETFVGGSLVEVGKNEIETVKRDVGLGPTVKTIFTESGGSLTSVKSSMEAFGTAGTVEGRATLQLATQQQWGLFPRPDFAGEAYSFTPSRLEYHHMTVEHAFTFEDIGSSDVELLNVKLVGAEAGHWEITDKNHCTTTTFVTLGHCELTVKLKEATAGGALLEGEVRYQPSGLHEPFLAKDLVN